MKDQPERTLFVGEEVPQPKPTPANSEDQVNIRNSIGGAHTHLNTSDIGIGLQDFQLDDEFMEQFDPSIKSKLKMITAAHENAKKYLDITVRALNNQKQYLKYMSEQNKDYQSKLEELEVELKREQSLKQKAEKDITMWKAECQKAEVTFNKIKARKRQIQVSLATMYDKYDTLMAENQSLRRLVENLTSSMEEKRNSCLPARKPKQAVPRVNLAEARSETTVRLPPITKASQGRGPRKSKRSGQPTLPPIGKDTGLHGDSGQSDTRSPYAVSLRTPTPWYKGSDNISNSNNSASRQLNRKV